MGVASMFGMFAGVYHWFPKMYGRHLNNTLYSFLGNYGWCLLNILPMHYEGLAGMPRRYYDYSIWESFKQFAELNKFISTVAIIVFAVQFLFLINFFFLFGKEEK
jgi:cytochrome c oxidase subunit 1